ASSCDRSFGQLYVPLEFPLFVHGSVLGFRTDAPYPFLPFSRTIHSCMYGQLLRSSTPPFSQAFRNRTISTSTSVTPLRSSTIRDWAPSSCVFNSSRCFDCSRPLSRIIVLSLSVSFSIRIVMCNSWILDDNK